MKAVGYSVKNTIKFFRLNGLPENNYYSWKHIHPRHLRGDYEPEIRVEQSRPKKSVPVQVKRVAREAGHPRGL